MAALLGREELHRRPRAGPSEKAAPMFPGSLQHKYICYCGQVVVGWPICRSCAEEMFAKLMAGQSQAGGDAEAVPISSPNGG